VEGRATISARENVEADPRRARLPGNFLFVSGSIVVILMCRVCVLRWNLALTHLFVRGSWVLLELMLPAFLFSLPSPYFGEAGV
jgi:hypothetical protein